MDNIMKLMMELHIDNKRQGPGGDDETLMALKMCYPYYDDSRTLRIADIGCGTGSQTLVLAKEVNAEITAVDIFPEFLERLRQRATETGVDNKITTMQASMDNLTFENDSFDIIWSEGAVYNIGFENGISSWRRFLKPGGLMVLSEISWLTDQRPSYIDKYWKTAYDNIDTISAKTKQLEQAGYTPIAHFVLPEHCWQENYYIPLELSHERFLRLHDKSEEAIALINADREEAGIYLKYKEYYSYVFYIARKTE